MSIRVHPDERTNEKNLHRTLRGLAEVLDMLDHRRFAGKRRRRVVPILGQYHFELRVLEQLSVPSRWRSPAGHFAELLVHQQLD